MNQESPRLHIVYPDGKVEERALADEELSIGRNGDNAIVLIDAKVSRNHARLSREGNDYVLTDLGSYNGTRVNGDVITRALLNHGDEITIGAASLTFYTREAVTPTAREKLEFSKEDEYGNWRQQTIAVNPEECGWVDSRSLMISPKERPDQKKRAPSGLGRKRDKQQAGAQAELSRLERMNKVLFVLYEISRHVNIIRDFKKLLSKIMDLIFMVIDADFGFLILIDEKEGGQLVPVVVKSKDDQEKGKQTVRPSRTLVNKVVQDRVALLTSNAMADPRLTPTESLLKQEIRSAICVPLWQKDTIIGAIQLDSTRPSNQFREDDVELLKAIGCQMSLILEQARLNERIREEEELRSRLERYNSPQVVDMIVRSGEGTKDGLLEAKDVSVTILFADIVGFTRLSERLSPLEVNRLLNRYFSRMTDVVFEYEGTLDKYVGDRIMAVFGAPLEKDDDAERAVRAALKMRKELAAMMETIDPEWRFSVRFGVNTGRAVAGNVGSPKRMDYTVIGDSVNIASRLESGAQPNQIRIGEKTFHLIEGKFKTRPIGPQTLKGRSEPIMVYEVLD
jgi:adenylate cyclase